MTTVIISTAFAGGSFVVAVIALIKSWRNSKKVKELSAIVQSFQVHGGNVITIGNANNNGQAGVISVNNPI